MDSSITHGIAFVSFNGQSKLSLIDLKDKEQEKEKQPNKNKNKTTKQNNKQTTINKGLIGRTREIAARMHWWDRKQSKREGSRIYLIKGGECGNSLKTAERAKNKVSKREGKKEKKSRHNGEEEQTATTTETTTTAEREGEGEREAAERDERVRENRRDIATTANTRGGATV